MFARKLLTGTVVGGLAASVIGLTAGAAMAVYSPDNDDLAPGSNADLIGVGSDTSQVVIKSLANAYNATSPANRLATFAATNGGVPVKTSGRDDTIPVPGAENTLRPNGSGAGKSTLYGTGNVPNIDFARSSSTLSQTEIDAGLQQFPFALDQLATVTSKTTNAPASLSIQQLVDIYKGTVTTWNQVGGTSTEAIKPLIPQAGSGTRTFFLAQLQAANGGVAFTPNVATFQENEDGAIKNDPNALAPFSIGRANLLGSLRIEGGFSANRALYNVVRGTELNAAGVQGVFGSAGFLCSTDATDLITAAGFTQLAPPARSGVCGAAGQAATTNFTTNAPVVTTSSLAGTSPSAGMARLVAGVSASTTPQGTFSFFEGNTVLAANVQLVSGQATANISTTPGAHTYTARFNPAGGSQFRRSSANATVTVSAVTAKAASTIAESFPAKAKVKVKTVKGKKKTIVKSVSGSITIAGGATRPSGTVLVKKGSKTVGSGSLINGVATFSINGLKPGTNKLTLTYGGDTATNGGVLNFTVKAGKTSKKKGKK